MREAPIPATQSRSKALHSLPKGYLDFLQRLVQSLEPRRQELLKKRTHVLKQALLGQMPDYLPESEAQKGNWKISVPDWAKDQRNQITGPADNAKLLIGMCNSGAPGCMPDGEDSITTDWKNVRAAQINTVAAIRGTLSYDDPETGEKRKINPSSQVIFYRPRGLHLNETRVLPSPYPLPKGGDLAKRSTTSRMVPAAHIGGREGQGEGAGISGSIFDISSVFFETIEERRAAIREQALQRKLCFYIPKAESAEEAGWWSDLIAAMEEAAKIPIGTTKIMFLIESLPAAYQVEEILYAARRHVIGLNLGRWDYMASLIHFKLADPNWILPDRNTIPHDIPFFQNIRYRIVDACHRRGALAIGGMTALFPNRQNPQLNERAMKRLEIDKKNEAAIGFDGAWTGHPDQQDVAVRQFPAPNQLKVTHPSFPKHPDLIPAPSQTSARTAVPNAVSGAPKGVGHITVPGTRNAIRTVIEYRFGVLSRLGARLIPGCDPNGELIGGFMEDLATDRIYRLMLAQRIRHQVDTEDGIKISADKVTQWFNEELEKLLSQTKDQTTQERYRKARQWSESMISKGEF